MSERVAPRNYEPLLCFVFRVNPLELMKHFPFWQTFENLLGILEQLLHLKFEVTEGKQAKNNIFFDCRI